MNIQDLIAANGRRWLSVKLTNESFNSVANRLVAHKDRYVTVSDATTVPWFVIAVIHERESSQDWETNLAQGDPFDKVSIHVPAGRGPFETWEDAAYDALMNCAPHAGLWKDWSAGGTLTLLEEYNGLGYAFHGVPSPYIWSGTDQYRSGKYTADHVYDPNYVDHQLGCAGLILAMMDIDKTISFTQPQTP